MFCGERETFLDIWVGNFNLKKYYIVSAFQNTQHIYLLNTSSILFFALAADNH